MYVLAAFVFVVAATGTVIWTLNRTAASTAGLVDGRLKPCPDTPNCVSTEAGDTAPLPLSYEGEPESARLQLKEFMDRIPRTELVTDQGDYLHFLVRSRVFRFVDDLEFRFDGDAKCIHVRSASRVGYSDLGVNQARLEQIRAEWKRVQEAGGHGPSRS